jgi:hypothetical protein
VAGVVGARRWLGGDGVEQCGVVAHGPVFDDQAVLEAEDVNLWPGDRVAVDRKGPLSRGKPLPMCRPRTVYQAITVSSVCVTRCSSTLRSAKLSANQPATMVKMCSPRWLLTLS